MKADDIPFEELFKAYEELKSSYKVAKKYGVSASAVKRILKNNNVLRNQSEAAKQKDISHLAYERTEQHRKNLSKIGKQRIGNKNPFFGKTHSPEVKEKLSKKSKERTGKRNPNYKDGEYQRRPRDFKIAEFTKLRNFVFNRDDYTCKYCGLMGGHLHAHHKIPYWVKQDAFLDVNNLVTVCTKCHFEKAHNGNWSSFDINLIDDHLLEKYSLDRERLTDLAKLNKKV